MLIDVLSIWMVAIPMLVVAAVLLARRTGEHPPAAADRSRSDLPLLGRLSARREPSGARWQRPRRTCEPAVRLGVRARGAAEHRARF